jgi:heme/copper-type cytochrome/quinol oxidase subunit 2
MVAVAAIVFTLVLFALVRYRRRGDELPRGRDEHKETELHPLRGAMGTTVPR